MSTLRVDNIKSRTGTIVTIPDSHTLAVTGISSIGGSQTIDGSQTVSGTQSVGGDQGVTGDQRVDGNQLISGVSTVSGSQTITGNISAGGISTFTGNTNFGGAVDVTGSLNVSGGGSIINTTGVATVGQLNVTGATSWTDIIAGVTTDLTVSRNLNVGGATTFTGPVSIAGTLTYDDVTNIDSVGLITARSGLVTPNADIDDFISVGSNIHLGNAGVCTATTFSGSGASLTALNATNLGSGTVPTARLGSGTANSGTYLRGDSSWAAVAAGGLTSAAGSGRNYWYVHYGSSWGTNANSWADTPVALDIGTVSGDGVLLVMFNETRREENWNQTSGRHLYSRDNGSQWYVFGWTMGRYNKHGSLPESNEYNTQCGIYNLTVSNGDQVKFKIQGQRFGGSNQYFINHNNSEHTHTGITCIKIDT